MSHVNLGARALRIDGVDRITVAGVLQNVTMSATLLTGVVASARLAGAYSDITNLHASGVVGIGNASAQAKLHVGAGATAPMFGTAANMIYINAGAVQADFLLQYSNTVAGGMYVDSSSVGIRAASNHPITFATNNTQREMITAAGVRIFGSGSAVGSATAGGFRATGICQFDAAIYAAGLPTSAGAAGTLYVDGSGFVKRA